MSVRRHDGVSTSPPIRANGGLVWRADGGGAVEVVLVHRPAYDDWTFPKGKPFRRESDEACAVREVEEETGLRCVPGHELGSVAYRDLRGRAKVVRYWEMVVASVVGEPDGREVDEMAWLPLGQIPERLTYGHDLAVLDDFCRWGRVS